MAPASKVIGTVMLGAAAGAAAGFEAGPEGNPMRARIVEVMKAHKRGEGALKPLLEAWMNNPRQGLRLTLAKDTYIFEDEEGELCDKAYKLSTLTTMFSKG